jgi:glycosyltransferase involved in cell wall biosynthesis/GT2 family glycosyltransferase
VRVLHLSSEYPPAKIYGLGRFVHGLARAQAAQGDQVFVLTNSTGGAEDDTVLEGVNLHRIAFPNPPRPADGHGEVLQFNHGLVSRFLDRQDQLSKVDVIASHDWLTALAAREIAKELKKPLVVTFHDEVVGKQFGNLDAQARFVRDLEALTAHDATRVIANSRFIAERVVRQYGVPEERLVAVHGGIDPESFKVSHEARIKDLRSVLASDGDVLVLYVGRFDQEKGLGILAEAALAAALERQNLCFAFVGSGREEAALRERLAPLGPRARVLGYVSGESLSYLYRAADVVVAPSLYEPFGLVALEAMVVGATVVVARSGGLAEIVRHEQDGLVVPPGDAAALAEALTRLAEDHPFRERLGRNGAERAQSEFSWQRVARATRLVYEEAIKSARSVVQNTPSEPECPLVSVTIATHNASAHVETALRSLHGRTDWPKLETIVVDNGSSADALARLRTVVAELRARRHEVRLLENAENRLFSAAQNQAIREARGEYVCLLNDDCEIPVGRESWLRGLVWALETLDSAGTVTPVTIQRDGRIYCAGAFSTGGHHLKDEVDRPGLLTAPRRTDWNNFACALTRRRYFDEIGSLREDGEFAHYKSDLEWCQRLTAQLGLAHWVHPVRLYHHSKEAIRVPAAPFQASLETRIPASVVLVAYNQLAYTRDAVDALLANTDPPFELVLVDNGSSDGTRDYFHELRDRLGGPIAVQVIKNPENLGYPKAANQGMRAARGRHAVLLNNDTRVRQGWLKALLEAATNQERVGIVTAKILCEDGRVQNAGGILHHPDGRFTLPLAHEDRLAPPVQERRVVESAGGPCMLLTRGLLNDVGIFDEAFSPAYFEDSDLGMRAREAGFVLVYEPGAEVFHKGKATAEVVAREGKLPIWERFEENKRLFYTRWSKRLAEDEEARRRVREREAGSDRKRVVLCYRKNPNTTAAHLEAALRKTHEVVTAGVGQDVDLGSGASATEIVREAGGDVDLLLVVEGDNYVPRELEAAPCPTAWWAIDNHIHARNSEGWHFKLAPAFDHVFVAQRDYLSEFRRRGVSSSWLPHACDPEVHKPHPVERDLDVLFVGNVLGIHARRRELLERLKRSFRVDEFHGVWRDDMARLFSRAKIVFNCSLAGDLNMRVFEALGCGSFLVTDRAGNGQESLFGDGEHLAVYDDRSLESVVDRHLSNDAFRGQIAERGRALVVNHHTYADRAREIFRTVALAVSGRRRKTLAEVRS